MTQPASHERNELAEFLVDLRTEYGITQDQLREQASTYTGTEPINIGTIRNAEGNIRPTKLSTLLRHYYYGIRPPIPARTWIKILVLWALKKHTEALHSLEVERQEYAQQNGRPRPKPLAGLKPYSYSEAMAMLGVLQEEDEKDEEFANCFRAIRGLRKPAVRTLTEMAQNNPDLLQHLLKVWQMGLAPNN